MAGAGWSFRGLDGNGHGGPYTTLAGGIALASGGAAIRQSVMILLSTLPGERVMRPDYGCPLHRIVFQPNDATTAGLAIHYVRSALTRFEPRAEILRLDAGPAADAAHILRIELDYRVRSTWQRDQVRLTVDLAGRSR
jgi:phage baseplate assembly protein W